MPWKQVEAFWTDFHAMETGVETFWTDFHAMESSVEAFWTDFHVIETEVEAFWAGFHAIETGVEAFWTDFQAMETEAEACWTDFNAIENEGKGYVPILPSPNPHQVAILALASSIESLIFAPHVRKRQSTDRYRHGKARSPTEVSLTSPARKNDWLN